MSKTWSVTSKKGIFFGIKRLGSETAKSLISPLSQIVGERGKMRKMEENTDIKTSQLNGCKY